MTVDLHECIGTSQNTLEGKPVTHNIQGIAVYIQIDDRLCLAMIDADKSEMFIGMLPAFQDGDKSAKLLYMPESVRVHIEGASRALAKHIEELQEKKDAGMAAQKAADS